MQERLRSEINDVNQDGVDLSYDEVMALPILDAVYKETARVSVTYWIYAPVTMNAQMFRSQISCWNNPHASVSDQGI